VDSKEHRAKGIEDNKKRYKRQSRKWLCLFFDDFPSPPPLTLAPWGEGRVRGDILFIETV